MMEKYLSYLEDLRAPDALKVRFVDSQCVLHVRHINFVNQEEDNKAEVAKRKKHRKCNFYIIPMILRDRLMSI